MKKIIIISSYSDIPEKEKTLVDCINSVSGKGYDIMITSHYPVPDYIQRMVNYCIYDSDNTFLPIQHSPYYWVNNSIFNYRININSHNLTILRNISNGVNISKSLGYELFYFMEYDNIFEESDFNKLDNLMNSMCINEKDMIFFKPTFSNENGLITEYCTLVFGGRLSWFLNTMRIPKSIEEYSDWVVEAPSNILEQIFYSKLFNYEYRFIIEPIIVENYFDKSIMNKYSSVVICEPCVSNDNDIFLFINNFSSKSIIVEINSQSLELSSTAWYYQFISTDLDIIIKDVNTNEIFSRKKFKLSELNKEEISNKSTINFL